MIHSNSHQAMTVLSERRFSKERAQESVLRTKDLTKQFKQRVVVDRLNLDIRKGEIYGFLGPNGAGKTTTIRMLLGLITPTAGAVEILGKDVQAYRAEVLPQVGALIEQPALYGYMSGRDNLRAFATALGGVAEQRIDEVLEIVGLKGRQKDRVRTYSLGMKQRLGIAVALLHDPQLLILDEPANGLDPAGIVEMRDFLHRLVDAGKTILISSHLLAEVQQICTRVAIINFGKLVAETSIEDLTKGAGDFKVAVERPAEALALIKSQTWGSQAYIDEAGYVITPSPDGQGRGLIAFLSHFGFVPDSVSPAERNLEQVFLQLTNGATGI